MTRCPTLRRALKLNPQEPLIQQAWQTLSNDTPAQLAERRHLDRRLVHELVTP